MKTKICGVIFVVSFLLLIGVVGGIECGQPLSNFLWCLPLLAAMGTSAYVGGVLR